MGRVFYGLVDPRNQRRIYQISRLPFMHEPQNEFMNYPEQDTQHIVGNSSRSSKVRPQTNGSNDSGIKMLNQKDDNRHPSTGYIYFESFIL